MRVNMSNRVKYPRTPHLPWSPGVSEDDIILSSLSYLNSKRVIVTEKMDGENTTLYSDHLHARSLDSRGHESRDWIKKFWSEFNYKIPKDWRICGENLFAQHSIHYRLPTYFMGFSVWNELNTSLSWDDTLIVFGELGITPVPVLYDGPFDIELIKKLWDPSKKDVQEGYVVRVARSIPYDLFDQLVGKFVRTNHIQTDKHWMLQAVIPNTLET